MINKTVRGGERRGRGRGRLKVKVKVGDGFV